MIRWLRPNRPFAHAARGSLLLVALWLGLGGPAWAGAGRHCARHGGHGAAQAQLPTILATPHTQCDHCPLDRCGATAPCSAPPSAGLRAAPPVVPEPMPCRVAAPTATARSASTHHPPPTPPPQPVT